MNVAFFFEVLIGGLLAGVMYSLVALGFVLMLITLSMIVLASRFAPDVLKGKI